MSLDQLLGGPVLAAARGLLGRRLTSSIGDTTGVVITEVEGYAGEDDPASHAHRGRTARNAVMFGPPGGLYVYRSYGVHWCMNVVCGPEGSARAVLLRGGVPVEGIDLMRERRGRGDHLTDGPGKLCQALGVTGGQDGSSVLHGPVTVTGESIGGLITKTPRIGISRAVDREWRFLLVPHHVAGL